MSDGFRKLVVSWVNRERKGTILETQPYCPRDVLSSKWCKLHRRDYLVHKLMRFYFESIAIDHKTAKPVSDDLIAEFLGGWFGVLPVCPRN